MIKRKCVKEICEWSLCVTVILGRMEKVEIVAQGEGMLFSHERARKFKLHLYEWLRDDKRLARIICGHQNDWELKKERKGKRKRKRTRHARFL